jgi:uncharacterized repeat protein (TIGR03803 family)
MNYLSVIKGFCSIRGGALASVLIMAFAHGVCAAEKVFHTFRGGSDGAYPESVLIIDASGSFYGTTNAGGGGTGCQNGDLGCGTVFRLNSDGSESVLYAFNGGGDGAIPTAGLIEDLAGNLYGTTAGGGTANLGTIFRLTPNNVETVLYSFQGGSDGASPNGLIGDGAGNFYGTTGAGGSNGLGTVFEIVAGGNEKVLYAFQGGSDGSEPGAGLIRDSSGNLYGTTGLGGGGTGCDDGDLGCGVVFKLAPDGTETVLYAFQGGNDGAFPEASLIRDGAGNFYGTTVGGGPDNRGTIFRLTPGGTETVLYAFKGTRDGDSPEAGLVMDDNGNLYGSTSNGGRGCGGSGCGTAFEVSSMGHEKILYAFHSGRGRFPGAALLLGPHGDLYGTTLEGGKANQGVVFKLKR